MGHLLRMQTKLHFEDLPENELPQWQQKIADAENIDRPNYRHFGGERIFRTKCDFLQVLELHILRIERRAIEAQRLQSIFTFFSKFYIEATSRLSVSV